MLHMRGTLKLIEQDTVLATTELVEAKPFITETPAAALLESALSEFHLVDCPRLLPNETCRLTEE
jgi:hypothetical protein